MAKAARKTAALMVVGAFLCVSSTRASDQGTPAGEVGAPMIPAGDAHIRSTSTAIKAAIDYGIRSSPTFSDLVRTIERSDSAVYLAEGDCGKRPACFVNVTAAGQQRLLWLIVDSSRARYQRDLIGSIGHELRHAVEVIDEPSVRSFGDKFFLYQRIGFHATGGGFETRAAMKAENLIRKEVRKFERQTKSR